MSIYIYRTQPSNSARELVAALGARRLRAGRRFRPSAADIIIAWGEAYDGPGRVLNGTRIQNKLADALALKEAGVPTIEVSTVKPAAPAPLPVPIDPIVERWNNVNVLMLDWPREFPGRSPVVLQGVQQLERALTAVRDSILNGPPPAQPVEAPVEWLGRTRNHVGGNDLLHPPQAPDFWVKKLDITREFRVHSFKGTSIRAGAKKPIEGSAPHEWIRSLQSGWKISYDGVSVRQAHRDLAHSACQALGLDFGAVDIAEERDTGRLIVLEVNRAPGLDGGTITAYANAIQRWIAGS